MSLPVAWEAYSADALARAVHLSEAVEAAIEEPGGTKRWLTLSLPQSSEEERLAALGEFFMVALLTSADGNSRREPLIQRGEEAGG